MYAHVYTERTLEVPTPCLRSRRFLSPKMRTLEKMSTRLPLQSPLFLLGLFFLRRLVEGRSKCCSRACLFCLISPLAIAAAMARNHNNCPGPYSLRTEHRLRKQPPLDRSSQPVSQSHGGGCCCCSVPWCQSGVKGCVSSVRATT